MEESFGARGLRMSKREELEQMIEEATSMFNSSGFWSMEWVYIYFRLNQELELTLITEGE